MALQVPGSRVSQHPRIGAVRFPRAWAGGARARSAFRGSPAAALSGLHMLRTSVVLAGCCALAVLAGTRTTHARAAQAAGEDNEIRQLRKDAEGGDARAQFRLGVRYATGTGIAEDDAVAAQWIRRAAEQGFVDAEYNLGLMYADGNGVPQDSAQAVSWLRK